VFAGDSGEASIITDLLKHGGAGLMYGSFGGTKLDLTERANIAKRSSAQF
jgi:hypothetical protein